MWLVMNLLLTTARLSEDGDEPPLPQRRSRDADPAAHTVNKTSKNTAQSMRSRSPERTYRSVATPSRARSRSPVKHKLGKTPESQRTLRGIEVDTIGASPGKTREVCFEQNTSTAYGTPTRGPARGAREPPAPIDVDLARAHARMAALRVGKQPAVVVHNPTERASSPIRQIGQYPDRASSPVRQAKQYPVVADDSSSYYSQESSTGDRYPPCTSPLRVQKDNAPKHISILQAYIDNANSTRGSDKESEVESQHQHHGTTDEASSGAELAYTPLGPFLPQGVPTVRKASKTLIGQGGWLENTSKPEMTTSPTRGGNFLGNLVKKAKEMASQVPLLPKPL